MAAEGVWLKWIESGQVFKACHVNTKDAQSQAAAEPQKNYLGVFDGPEDDSKKLAEAGGSS